LYAISTLFQRHFNAISTPFQRDVNTILTLFQHYYNTILTRLFDEQGLALEAEVAQTQERIALLAPQPAIAREQADEIRLTVAETREELEKVHLTLC